jgi:glucosamine 6-phosphate synthetase-like amidotransferase/phosphosugar isomerase protein
MIYNVIIGARDVIEVFEVSENVEISEILRLKEELNSIKEQIMNIIEKNQRKIEINNKVMSKGEVIWLSISTFGGAFSIIANY